MRILVKWYVFHVYTAQVCAYADLKRITMKTTTAAAISTNTAPPTTPPTAPPMVALPPAEVGLPSTS